MALTRRQRAALDAVCETFVPGAVELGVPEAVVETLTRTRPPAEQAAFRRLLSLWDWPLAAGPRRFSALPRERREDVLRSWRDSRVAQRRTAYKVLRKAALAHALGLPLTAFSLAFSRSDSKRASIRPISRAAASVGSCDMRAANSMFFAR